MNKLAKENDHSLYSFVNESFELTLRANKLGANIRTLSDSRELLNDARDNGFTLGLETLWYEMAEIAYDKAKKKALQNWFEAGVWLAKRYITSEIADPLETFKNDLKDFTWNVPELVVKPEKQKVTVRIVSPRFTEAYTYLFTSFLEGALESFDYKICSKDVSTGFICLTAIKR